MIDTMMIKTREVADRLGISRHTLDYWIRNDVFSVSQPARGTGTFRGWSTVDAVKAEVVRWLRRHITLQAIRKTGILEQITEETVNADSVIVYDKTAASVYLTLRQSFEELRGYMMQDHERAVFYLKDAAKRWEGID
jgi:DNA-binding transcriptional MerR regulator